MSSSMVSSMASLARGAGCALVGRLCSIDVTQSVLYHVSVRSVFQVAQLVSGCQKRVSGGSIGVSLSEAWLR